MKIKIGPWRVRGRRQLSALPSTPSPETRYATTTAGYERARLDDGSTLELNAASAVRVQFTAAERRVKLESGEAHFAVAHDTARPFIVSAGGIAVRAVGTAFNVRYATGGDIEVTVTEGKVAVSGVERVDPNALSAAIFVSAGQRIVLPHHAPPPTVEQVDPAALRAALVYDTLYREGEFVAAGLPVLALLPPENIKVRFYVSDSDFAALKAGDTVRVALTGHAPLAARISYLSPKPEYTPPVLYNRENRAKLVWLVEAVFTDPSVTRDLHPGQPVDVQH